ncbi:MAG: adenine phosphoribosyltransferase [Verrucomicrobiota bacterium JB024]|nr:adenine phosphoribosyltransferase [Verrucomicrobiota bacterium JB024]
MTEEAIKSNIRTIRNWPQKGINFRDVTTLFENSECFRTVIDRLVEWARTRELSSVAGIDARGFVLAGALAYQLGLPLILVRKKGKLPAETLSENYTLEYGQATIEVHDTDTIRGQNVLVVDDLLATGGTALAAIRLMRRLGAERVDFATIINLSELPGRQLLQSAGIHTFALCSFNETE